MGKSSEILLRVNGVEIVCNSPGQAAKLLKQLGKTDRSRSSPRQPRRPQAHASVRAARENRPAQILEFIQNGGGAGVASADVAEMAHCSPKGLGPFMGQIKNYLERAAGIPFAEVAESRRGPGGKRWYAKGRIGSAIEFFLRRSG